MYIEFRNTKLRKICNDYTLANTEWGERIARKLFQRLNEIAAANCLKDLSHLPPTRCHQLQGSRKGQFAVDLVHPFRLIFVPIFDDEKEYENNKDIDLSIIKGVKVIEVVNYHDE